MIATFIIINIGWVLLYAVYWLFLRKDTLFQLKRGFFLVATIMILTIPFIRLPEHFIHFSKALNSYFLSLPEYVFNGEQREGFTIDWWKWGVIAYISIALIILIWRLRPLRSIRKILSESVPTEINGTRIYINDHISSPFSFFGWVVLPEKEQDEMKKRSVLSHELTHARQWHSIDIMLMEILSALFWINPFVYLLRRAVGNNLEFIADSSVVKQGIDRKKYQYHLLEYSFSVAAANLYNNFNVSPIKKRIIMMNKKKSNKLTGLKYVFMVPAVALAMLFANSSTTAKNLPAVVSTNVMQTPPPASQNKSGDEVFQVADKLPEFPGGINGLMTYLGENVQYPKEAVDKKLEERVIVSFVVGKDGSVRDAKIIRGQYDILNKEALRVVNAMPKWTPGENKGELVSVQYTLPIMFKLKSDKVAVPAAKK